MNAHAEWMLKVTWLVQLLTLWLKIPKTGLTLTCIILLSLVVGGYHLLAWKNTFPPEPALPRPVTANQSIARTPQLPDLTSFALYELAQPLVAPQISQQGEKFSLDFAASWPVFADFINHIGRSSFAPESYHMQWQPMGVATQLDLATGRYLAHNLQVIVLPFSSQPTIKQMDDTAHQDPPTCPHPPSPEFTLQASWPSRGYIQVFSEGRLERINVNEVLQNSWKLLRIGSDSLEFRWQAPNLACNNSPPVTVAI